MAYTHLTTVAFVQHNHGYPYRATCTCGWQSNTYIDSRTADMAAHGHLRSDEPKMVGTPFGVFPA